MVNVHSAGLPPPGDVLLLLSEPPFPNEKIFHLTTIDTIIAIGELWDAEALIPGCFNKCREGRISQLPLGSHPTHHSNAGVSQAARPLILTCS